MKNVNNECFTCATLIDIQKENKFNLVMQILQITEGMINSLLNHKPEPPLDECGEMKMSVEKTA